MYALALAAVAAEAAAARPNIILLLSESLDGRLLRPDSAARIPNIRALMAAGSVRFDAAYSNNPVCAPSRSSMFSGRAPHKIPHMHNGMAVGGVWNNYEGLPDDYSDRIDQVLARAGYNVSMQGKSDWSIGGHTETCFLASFTFNVAWPYNITGTGGWNQEDDSCASPGPVQAGGSGGPAGSVYPRDWDAMRATAAFAASATEPFFAYAGTTILHPPYATSQHWYEAAGEDPAPLPVWPPLPALHACDLQAAMKRGCTPGADNASAHAAFYAPARIARVRRVYRAELEEYDAMVGAVVAAVRAAGRAANTYIVLAADHGDMQLEHQMFYKMVPYDASSRVPLVFASAAALPQGRSAVVSQPVQLLDVFPTLLALAGLPVPAYADGYDLAPFLAGAPADPSRPPTVAWQNHDEDISMSWFAVTDGAHKLVQYGSGAEGVPPQLFDLAADPGELANVANASAADRARVAALDAALRTHIDYPAVAREVAAYQRAQFRWWAANGTAGRDWRAEIASADVRWQASWARFPQQALAAVEHWLAGNESAPLRPCDGRLVTAAAA